MEIVKIKAEPAELPKNAGNGPARSNADGPEFVNIKMETEPLNPETSIKTELPEDRKSAKVEKSWSVPIVNPDCVLPDNCVEMAWDPKTQDAPANFVTALYGEEKADDYLEVGVDSDGEEELYEDYYNDNQVPPPSWPSPLYSSLTSPERRRTGAADVPAPSWTERRRSMSPAIDYESPQPVAAAGIVMRIYNLEEQPLEDLNMDEDNYDNDFTVFMSPDAHALYESERLETVVIDEQSDIQSGSRGLSVESRGRSARDRTRRGHRGCRQPVRGNRENVRRGQGSAWQTGHPLEEIWTSDEDVPFELKQMAREIVMRRQSKVLISEALSRRTRERPNKDNGRANEDEDVFEDAVDGRSNPLGVDSHFEWSSMDSFQGGEELFRPERTGNVSSYISPYDAFRSFWDDDILKTIVAETNRYASKISSATFKADWYPTNSHEILCLFGFWIMMGIIRLPTIHSYFSTNSLLKTEIFSRITSLKRYKNLNRALNFINTDHASNAHPTNLDPVYCLRPIIDHLNSKFQSNYILSKDICLNESLTKDKLNIKQNIQSKAAKFGIKTVEVCESATGYLWSFLVYTGKTSISKSTAVVFKLMQPLLNKGYRLFMDDWFNSPFLARLLKRNGTDCVGTLRESCVDVPYLVTHAPLKQGQLIARHSGDICVLSWLDKERVTMLSTCHGSSTALPSVRSRRPTYSEPYKPQMVLDYNKSMRGVDLKDHMLEPYLLERKNCNKWYLKLFKRLLNASIQNSRILLASSLGAGQDNLTFRLELVNAILTNHHSRIPEQHRYQKSVKRTASLPHILHHIHWPVRVGQSASELAKNRAGRHRCVVCLKSGRKNIKTQFKCEACNVPLCIENCFKFFHTIPTR